MTPIPSFHGQPWKIIYSTYSSSSSYNSVANKSADIVGEWQVLWLINYSFLISQFPLLLLSPLSDPSPHPHFLFIARPFNVSSSSHSHSLGLLLVLLLLLVDIKLRPPAHSLVTGRCGFLSQTPTTHTHTRDKGYYNGR